MNKKVEEAWLNYARKVITAHSEYNKEVEAAFKKLNATAAVAWEEYKAAIKPWSAPDSGPAE